MDKVLIGLPVGLSMFLVMLTSDGTGLLLLGITTIVTVIVTAAVTGIVGSFDGISFLGFGVDFSDWGKRFLAIFTFVSVYFLSNMLAGLDLILSIPSFSFSASKFFESQVHYFFKTKPKLRTIRTKGIHAKKVIG